MSALTPADCKAFYQTAFVPNNTVCVVVGDFDSKQMLEEVTRLTANWKATDLAKPTPPEVTKPAAFVQKIVVMPEAAQLYFFMGHVGIRRGNPDFYRLLVMDYVLGTSTGFNDRLSARLRDREGFWLYTVQRPTLAGPLRKNLDCLVAISAPHRATSTASRRNSSRRSFACV